MSEKKTFGLKAIESQLLGTTHQNSQAIMSNILTLIASERLAYHVTENTRFDVSNDLSSITIYEAIVPEASEAPPETETAKALKGKK